MKCTTLVHDIHLALNAHDVYLLIIRCSRLFWTLKTMDDRWKRPHHNIAVQTIDISKSMTKHTMIEKKPFTSIGLS